MTGMNNGGSPRAGGYAGGGYSGGPSGGETVSNGQPARDMSWVRMGDNARAGTQHEQAANAERRELRATDYLWPNRYFLKANPGQNGMDHIGDIIVLDAQPGPCYYEHLMPGDNGWKNLPVPCAKEIDNCPLCPPNGEDESSYVMLLTVLNLKGYWSTKENRQIHPTRELMVVKTGQHDQFWRLTDEHGSLRGLQMRMIRNGQRSPRIGDIDTATPIRRHSDESIEAYLTQLNKMGPETYVKDGKTIEKFPARHMVEPFDYGVFLLRPDTNLMRQRWGGSAPLGNDQHGQDSDQWGNAAPGHAGRPMGTMGGQGGGFSGPSGGEVIRPAAEAVASGPTDINAAPGNISQSPENRVDPNVEAPPVRQRRAPGSAPATTGTNADLKDEIPF